MQYPTFLKPGDTIGVTATSAGNGDELHIRKVESAISEFRKRGYFIKETPNVRTDNRGRSSSKTKRAEEFMSLMQNPEVKAIITARGGEFLLEILPFLDFETIQKNPKWVQGYSDTTGLGFCITTICEIATIYGENFGAFGMQPWHVSLEENLALLEGKERIQNSFEKYQEGWQEEITGLEPYKLTKKVEWKNAKGEEEISLEGRLLGGCLDSLISLVGTKWDNVMKFCQKYENDGIIWFLDNCELTSEGVLRGLWQLKEAGWFTRSQGIYLWKKHDQKK